MKPTEFHKFKLKPEILKNLDSLGFKSMTDIQSKSLPHVLNGGDVIAQAQTGSGKTLAFGLGVLSRTVVADYFIQSLILCPTRELATQVATELRRLGRMSENLKVLLLCGGTPTGPQIESLRHGAHIVVGTPGRILDLISKRCLNLKEVKTLVLDEADRMLDMGFAEDIESIVKRTPPTRQSLLFSATFPDNISAMSQSIQNSPIHIKAAKTTNNSSIEQKFFETKKDEKYENLISVFAQFKPSSSIVFCTTKIQCKEVAQFLCKYGLVAQALHGDLEQYERDEVMVRFANSSVSVLVATDVAARGLDVKELSAVINFELSKDPEVHVHRVGRTGRAGHQGLALSLYNRSEEFRLKSIEKLTGVTLERNAPLKRFQGHRLGLKPPMRTLKISGGKKNKLRPGDILGALTKKCGIPGDKIGKINVFDFHTYTAVSSDIAESACRHLEHEKIKNKNFRTKLLL